MSASTVLTVSSAERTLWITHLGLGHDSALELIRWEGGLRTPKPLPKEFTAETLTAHVAVSKYGREPSRSGECVHEQTAPFTLSPTLWPSGEGLQSPSNSPGFETLGQGQDTR